jgi:hypothetical protein
MLVRESPGGRDGWLMVREGVGSQRSAGGGAGIAGEGSERADSAEKLLVVTDVGSWRCSGLGLGSAQGDTSALDAMACRRLAQRWWQSACRESSR